MCVWNQGIKPQLYLGLCRTHNHSAKTLAANCAAADATLPGWLFFLAIVQNKQLVLLCHNIANWCAQQIRCIMLYLQI